jgi:hypothetical protein
MEQPATDQARQLLENLWYTVCEKYFQRIVQVTGLDKEREQAVRAIVLRPNDFRVVLSATEEDTLGTDADA